ncbi:hypothetical protein PoB_000527200 [Plakobranchus ocellatus]|uniref:Uncharacterized protein n=1 Tax=Plakobranchus ocellatus TaxID=259542 RepID=A0AAV3Y7J7_9GAST|nr:hypothetical protein PoB_000527200 [Plakobranchus ocellatus]
MKTTKNSEVPRSIKTTITFDISENHENGKELSWFREPRNAKKNFHSTDITKMFTDFGVFENDKELQRRDL